MKENKQSIIRWIVFSGIILISFLLQTTSGLFPQIRGIHANLLIPAVICIGMHEKETPGAVFGLMAGVFWDTVVNHVPGYHSILLMVAGCVSGLLITHLMRNNILAALFLSGASILVHDVLYWVFFRLFPAQEGYIYLLVNQTLPSMLYTFLLTPFYYLIVHAISKRLREKT